MVVKRHRYSKLLSVGHPRESGKCNFIDELRKSGRLMELLEKGRLPIKNISPFAGKVRYLPCPVCKIQNPVSRANLRMRCSGCGTPLLSIKVRKPKHRKK